MNTQLQYLDRRTLLTALIWVPYILNEILVSRGRRGIHIRKTILLAVWATRMKAAHYNAVENLAVLTARTRRQGVALEQSWDRDRLRVSYFQYCVAHVLAYTSRCSMG